MTIRKQRGNRHFFFHAVLSIVIAFSATALNAGELSENAPRAMSFEVRPASHEKVEGWQSVPAPGPSGSIWISPEVALTNDDVARAQADQTSDGMPCVHLLLTEEGALKLARLTKAHIGEPVAMMIDGRVVSAPNIMDEIIGGQAMLLGNFTPEEARSIAEGILVR